LGPKRKEATPGGESRGGGESFPGGDKKCDTSTRHSLQDAKLENVAHTEQARPHTRNSKPNL